MCKCCIDESTRSHLGISTTILSSFIAFVGICLILVALYIKYQIEDKILLFGTYDGGILTSVIIISGCVVLFANLIVAKASFDCSYTETRDRFKKLLMLCLVLMSLVCLLLFVCAVLCYTHKYILNRALKKGMASAMKRYRSHRHIKAAIDKMQVEFMCCGSQSYKDWFQTSWIPLSYLKLSDPAVKMKLVNGLYITDDVPFSCCDVTSIRPCIHHQVTDRSAHYNYRRPTLYRNGCKDTLKLHYHDTVLLPTGHTFLVLLIIQFVVHVETDARTLKLHYHDTVLLSTGHTFLVLLIIQIVDMVLLRLLQTSIFSAQQAGDPGGPGFAFCCEFWPCQNKPMDDNAELGAMPEMPEMPTMPGMPETPQMPEFGGAGGGGGAGGAGAGGGADQGKTGKGKDKAGKDKADKATKGTKDKGTKGKKGADGKKSGKGGTAGKKAGKSGATGKKLAGKKVKTGKKAGGKKKMGKKK